MSEINIWAYEEKLQSDGYKLICGVDEAGRGPLAGPVCAAAVILPMHAEIPGLNDSKKLSDKKRRELFPLIKEKAIAYAISFSDEKEIDRVNILQATFLAMQRAIEQLPVVPEYILIDGNKAPQTDLPVQTIVKGDSLSASIAAASVLAKVTRDDLMLQMAEQYPGYGFDVHKGYGTKVHYAALAAKGPCLIHRKSFLKKLYGTE